MNFRVHYSWDGETNKIDIHDVKYPKDAEVAARKRIASNIIIHKTKVLKETQENV